VTEVTIEDGKAKPEQKYVLMPGEKEGVDKKAIK
jgi:hypothetical protein